MKVDDEAMPGGKTQNDPASTPLANTDVTAQVLRRGGRFGAYNVVASYTSPAEAKDAIRALRSEGVPDEDIELLGAPGPGTQSGVRGTDNKLSWDVALWAIAGIIVLGGIAGTFGLLLSRFVEDFQWWMGLLWGILVFGTLGGVAGGLFGIAASRASDESKAEPGVLVEVSASDPRPVERAASVLARFGPRRLWRLDSHGDVV